MYFTIDEQYITNVVVRTQHDLIKDRSNPTPEDLCKIRSGTDKIVVTGNKDHDEFTHLRLQLEELGYIKVEKRWWNGDVVIKPFYLNGWQFKKGNRFPCAAALHTSISCAKEYGYKSISI